MLFNGKLKWEHFGTYCLVAYVARFAFLMYFLKYMEYSIGAYTGPSTL